MCVLPQGLNEVKSGVWTVVRVTHTEFGATRRCVWSSTAIDWKCNHHCLSMVSVNLLGCNINCLNLYLYLFTSQITMMINEDAKLTVSEE